MKELRLAFGEKMKQLRSDSTKTIGNNVIDQYEASVLFVPSKKKKYHKGCYSSPGFSYCFTPTDTKAY
jgi:hypothetical protein